MGNIIVYTKGELKEAIQRGDKHIIVKGKLAKKIQPFSKVKKSQVSNLSSSMSANMVAGVLVDVPTVVAITLIITIGVVTIVAILKNYRIIIRKPDEEIILEKN